MVFKLHPDITRSINFHIVKYLLRSNAKNKSQGLSYQGPHIINCPPLLPRVCCGLDCMKVPLGSAMDVHARMQESGLKEKCYVQML